MVLVAILMCANFTSCNEKDEDIHNGISLFKTSYTMYSHDSTTIEGHVSSNATWHSDTEFSASAEGDQITSNLVGTTNLYYSGNISSTTNLGVNLEDSRATPSHTIKIVVKPRYYLYDDPILAWGESMQSLKNKLGGSFEESENALNCTTNNSKCPFISYMFENNKLTSIGYIVPIEYSDELIDFLGERVVPVIIDEFPMIFGHFSRCTGGNLESDYLVSLDISNNLKYFGVIYMKYEYSSAQTKSCFLNPHIYDIMQNNPIFSGFTHINTPEIESIITKWQRMNKPISDL